MTRQHGFSLVELMIVVAIIGILAAIAIPNYINMQLRAKRAEVPSNVNGIKVAQGGYDATHDGYLDCSPQPRVRTSLDKEPVAWVTASSSNWHELGWAPDGLVRGMYETNATDSTTGFAVNGAIDADDDSQTAEYTAGRDQEVTLSTPPSLY